MTECHDSICACVSFGHSTATLVFNLLLAPILHGTNLGVSDVVFTSLIIFGVVLCILGSNSTQQEYSLEKLYELAFSRPFQILVASELALFAILQMHARRREQNGQGHLLSTGVAYPICAGMLGGATVLCAKVLTSAVSLGADVLTVLRTLVATKSYQRTHILEYPRE